VAKGKTRSSLKLGARREAAAEMFAKGFTNVEVADEIQVSPGTVARYRATYEERLATEARLNPGLLKDVLGNTVRALEELEKARAAAWQVHERTGSETAKLSALNTVLKAQDQRAKLFQLMGVKADFLAEVSLVRQQQEQLVKFMGEALCPEDQRKLEDYLVSTMTGDLALLPEVPGQ
jgi:predicted transcriptional regulator